MAAAGSNSHTLTWTAAASARQLWHSHNSHDLLHTLLVFLSRTKSPWLELTPPARLFKCASVSHLCTTLSKPFSIRELIGLKAARLLAT